MKKTRRKISRSVAKNVEEQRPFIEYTDQLTNLLFAPELLKIFKVTASSVSNHMAALIASKSLVSELEAMHS